MSRTPTADDAPVPTSPRHIRNVVLVGPPGAGKSTLFEHLVAARVDGGVGTLVEVNSETDFVAKSEPFITLADQVLEQAVKVGASDAQALLDSFECAVDRGDRRGGRRGVRVGRRAGVERRR